MAEPRGAGSLLCTLQPLMQPLNRMLPHPSPPCTPWPDLYKGKVGVDKEEAQHLMSNLDFPTAVQEIKACVQYLRE